MKKNIDNIPDHIFNWVQTTDYSHLLPARQAEVLSYFSLEEYEQMHRVILNAQKISQAGDSRFRIKQQLLQEFDKHRPAPVPAKKNQTNLLLYRMPLWQAAAVLLIGVLSGFWLMKTTTATSEMAEATKIDTVFVEKQVNDVMAKVIDTVYVVQKIIGASASAGTSQSVATPVAPPVTTQSEYVLSLNVLENPANLPKKNSMKHDSLVKSYPFVTL